MPGKKQKRAAQQWSAEQKKQMKQACRAALANQLQRLYELSCPSALAACCSLAGDLWKSGDTKGVRCILGACMHARDSDKMLEVLTAMAAASHERGSEVPLKVTNQPTNPPPTRLCIRGGWGGL